jgi:hypothetical protein
MPRVRGSISAGCLTDEREKYYHSLKALTIREKKIHIVGSPQMKIEGTPVYLDVEGLPVSSDARAIKPALAQASDGFKFSTRTRMSKSPFNCW